jgi:hypothetical protein
VIGIVTRLQVGPSGVRIPSRVRNLSFLHKVQTGSGAYTSSHTMVNEAFALGLKRQGREADRSQTSSPKFRNQSRSYLYSRYMPSCWL